MSDRSITQLFNFGAIDFSRPALVTTLLLALVGLSLTLIFYQPYALSSAVERQQLPGDVAALGMNQFQSFGVETAEQLVTVQAKRDKQLIIFVRNRLGVRKGNERLQTTIPGAFWEVALRSRDDY